jgi:hypothetical protein
LVVVSATAKPGVATSATRLIATAQMRLIRISALPGVTSRTDDSQLIN